MKYKINWMEKKVSAKGMPYVKASLLPEGGQEITDVTIFSSFVNFANLMPGSEVEGDLEVKQNGQYTNKTLNMPKAQGTFGGGGYKNKQIAESMQTKAENIKEAQDRSAWMWAKNNASTLLAGTPHVDTPDLDKIANEVITLATKIYNGEPTEPF